MDSVDLSQYAARVNKNCEKFDVGKCTVDDFKILMFFGGLSSSQDLLILEKPLTERAEMPKMILQGLINEVQVS